MDLKRQQIDAFTVAGLRVRTTNAAEHQPQSAKIGPMWGRFFSEEQAESIPGKIPGSAIYGVYSAYESDASGAFDVTAGVAVNARPKAMRPYRSKPANIWCSRRRGRCLTRSLRLGTDLDLL
jgi:predicted transcriptional regulator YdeE